MKVRSSLTATLLVALLAALVNQCAASSRAPPSPPPVDDKSSSAPTVKPTEAATPVPTIKPTDFTARPTPAPSAIPTTPEPTSIPTPEPSPIPTPEPTPQPTPFPTTESPTFSPTDSPTFGAPKPSSSPTTRPATQQPTKRPTAGMRPPSTRPTSVSPTLLPSAGPTQKLTQSPSLAPSKLTTPNPTGTPTNLATPNPTGTPSKVATPIPTTMPTMAATNATASPTKMPSNRPSSKPVITIITPPSSAPTRPVTAAPTMVPSRAPSTLEPTELPSQVPSQNLMVVVDATSKPTTPHPTPFPTAAMTEGSPESDPQKYDIVADVQSWADAIDFVVSLSLWSSEKLSPEDDERVRPIKEAMLTSVRMMYCEDHTTNVCVVKNDMLLASKEIFVSAHGKQGPMATTLMVPRIGGVHSEGVEPLVWTSWRISFQIVQLGVQYIQELLSELDEGSEIPVRAETILQLVPEMIKQKVTKDIENSIREGTFDGLLHGNLGNDAVVSSVTGEEVETFQSLITLPPPQSSQLQNSVSQKEEGGDQATMDLAEVAIYVSIACTIIAMAACGLAYVYTVQTSKSALAETNEQTKAAERAQSLRDGTDLVVESPEPSSSSEGPESTSTSTSSVGGDEETTTTGPGYIEQKKSGLMADLASLATPSLQDTDQDSATESDTDGDLSTAVASWQIKPRRFVLQQDTESKSHNTPKDEDTTTFPTSGSLVAGSVMVGSVGGESVESSLDGWSVNSSTFDMNWA